MARPYSARHVATGLNPVGIFFNPFGMNVDLSKAQTLCSIAMMDWERSNGSSSSPEEEEEAAAAPPDRMVKIEMEAAEALADLAQFAPRGSGGGKAARKRVKTESLPSLSALNLLDSARSRPPDLDQQQPLPHPIINHLKSEQSAEPFDESDICTTKSVSFGGGKSRYNLSEAEKEEKRLRRVLANRESARRTIRRRQALCEELSRKAIELTEENEKLKKGKEAALQEFQMLETTNKHLKAEVAEAAKCEAVGSMSELEPGRAEMPSSLLNFPMLFHNTVFTPRHWPQIFQSHNSSQSYQVLPTLPFVPANVNTQASCRPDRPHDQTLQSISEQRNPVYIVPCPWIFALSNQGHHCEPSHCPTSERDNKPVDNQDGAASSSRTALSSSECGPVLPASVEPQEDARTARSALVNDLNEMPIESPVDQCDEHVGVCCASDPDQADSTGVETARHEGRLCSGQIEKTNAPEVPSVAGTDLTEKEIESVGCSSDKRIVGATLAASARRRRKELTKLKALHGRQCRTNC